MTFNTVEDIQKFIADEEVEFIDIRFTDVPGTEHHFSIPSSEFDEGAVEEGLAFDGSSIRGFTTIDESDMTLLPDLSTAVVDPFRKAKTLNIKFFVHDPFTQEPFSRDPRNVARKAEEYLASTGIADVCQFGAEAEFYIFDSVRYSTDTNQAFSTSIPMRVGGTATRSSTSMAPTTWAIRPRSRVVISRSHRRIRSRICATI